MPAREWRHLEIGAESGAPPYQWHQCVNVHGARLSSRCAKWRLSPYSDCHDVPARAFSPRCNSAGMFFRLIVAVMETVMVPFWLEPGRNPTTVMLSAL